MNDINFGYNQIVKDPITDGNHTINIRDIGIFQGEIKNNKREGFGRFYTSLYKYVGSWKNDHPDGNGKIVAMDKKIGIDKILSYEGEWNEGKMHGNGKIIYVTGESYVGFLKENSKHGLGKFYNEHGQLLFDCEWDDNIPCGKIKMKKFWDNGNLKFDGSLDDDGLETGYGYHYNIDGTILYSGNFDEGKYHGDGTLYYDKLNDGKEGTDVLPDVPGLFQKYQDMGIVSAEESDGGFVPTFKAGLVFDTRDNRPNPMKGVWTEAVIVAAPEFLGGESTFAKFSLTHRQYFTLIPNDLSLAYRLAYQTTIAGDVPFYYQSQVITSVMKGASSEGLGGAKSLRGIRRNRIVGDGIFYGNIEARWKFVRFNFINNNFYLGLNGFMDFGKVTKKIELNTNSVPDYFDIDAEGLHLSYGAGLRIVMNQNFIIAVDYGMAADERDGSSGMYIGLNYLF